MNQNRTECRHRFDDSGNADIVKSLHQALHLIVDRFTDFAAEIDI